MSASVAAARVELIEDIAGFERDPLGYVLYAFPWGAKGTELENQRGPRRWQRGVLESIGEKLRALPLTASDAEVWEVIREAVASGHGIGKSALVAMIIKWALDTREDTRGVVTANTDTQLRTKTWPELAKWHRLSITRDWFELTATALASTVRGHEKNWRMDAVPWSETNTEAFAGLHNEGKRLVLIFDEASAIADKVWEVAEGALTDAGTEILWLVFGNATRATGRFRECFRKYKHRWTTRQIDSRTVEGINLAEVNKLVEDHGEDSDTVKVRVRGVFPAMSAKQFISETDVDAAFGRHLRKEQYDWAPVIIGVDPAWEGDDELTIYLRQGLMSRKLLTMAKNDNDVQVANTVARLEDEHKADAVFVDAGYGTGIVSVGRSLQRDWQLVWFGSESADPGCLNKRSEMWNSLKKWLKEGGAIEPDNTLRDELLSPETMPRLDGKIQLESKDHMKRRGLPSPNRADGLALTFAYPVQAKPRNSDGTVFRDMHEDNYARQAGSEAGEIYNPMG